MNKYSAKLLFQWRPVRKGVSRKRRVCEERIIVIEAVSAREALKKVKKIGKKEEYNETNDGIKIFFEFIGVQELKDISLSFSDGEVWYELREMVNPMERKSKLIPKENKLDALRKKSTKQKRPFKILLIFGYYLTQSIQ